MLVKFKQNHMVKTTREFELFNKKKNKTKTKQKTKQGKTKRVFKTILIKHWFGAILKKKVCLFVCFFKVKQLNDANYELKVLHLVLFQELR